jgi:hypothetical protein
MGSSRSAAANTQQITLKEANMLADNLSRCGGKQSLATRIAAMESHCRQGVPAYPGDAAADPSQRRLATAA